VCAGILHSGVYVLKRLCVSFTSTKFNSCVYFVVLWSEAANFCGHRTKLVLQCWYARDKLSGNDKSWSWRMHCGQFVHCNHFFRHDLLYIWRWFVN
jgi:hypothetical protein